MTDLVMLEASLFHLRTAIASIEDELTLPQLELTMSVLANAVAAAHASLNAARVVDLEFALNDVAGAADSLSADDAARLAPAMEMLRADLAALKSATALPSAVLSAIADFRARLAARRSAIERKTFLEEGAAEPPPHPPQELAPAATALQEQLAGAGFATPALDAFVAEPHELRFHQLAEIIDELDTIA